MTLFSENGVKAHCYLVVAGIILLIIVLVYVYVCEHQVSINNNETWKNIFSKENINPLDITHDDNVWYFQGISTCVAYNGDYNKKCNKSENYCAGDRFYGNIHQQVLAIKEAIKNKGEHPLCPLIYQGGD